MANDNSDGEKVIELNFSQEVFGLAQNRITYLLSRLAWNLEAIWDCQGYLKDESYINRIRKKCKEEKCETPIDCFRHCGKIHEDETQKEYTLAQLVKKLK